MAIKPSQEMLKTLGISRKQWVDTGKTLQKLPTLDLIGKRITCSQSAFGRHDGSTDGSALIYDATSGVVHPMGRVRCDLASLNDFIKGLEKLKQCIVQNQELMKKNEKKPRQKIQKH